MLSPILCRKIFNCVSSIMTFLTLIFCITGNHWIIWMYNFILCMYFFSVANSLKNYWRPSCGFYVFEALMFTAAAYSMVFLIYEKIGRKQKSEDLEQMLSTWNCFKFVTDFVGIALHVAFFSGWNVNEPDEQEDGEQQSNYESFEPVDNNITV